MGFPQRVEYYDTIDELKRNFEKADQRYRSYRLIKTHDRIETVFERLRQERLHALTRYRQAVLEEQVALVHSIMNDRKKSLWQKMSTSVQTTRWSAFCLWLWRKL